MTGVDGDGATEDDHLEDLDDGCGCVEVWTHLSEHRSDKSGTSAPADIPGKPERGG